jgi:hypothetical protein
MDSAVDVIRALERAPRIVIPLVRDVPAAYRIEELLLKREWADQ